MTDQEIATGFSVLLGLSPWNHSRLSWIEEKWLEINYSPEKQEAQIWTYLNCPEVLIRQYLDEGAWVRVWSHGVCCAEWDTRYNRHSNPRLCYLVVLYACHVGFDVAQALASISEHISAHEKLEWKREFEERLKLLPVC